MKADILNRDWHYTPSSKTDLKKTFARIRREQKLAADKKAAEFTRIISIKRGA